MKLPRLNPLPGPDRSGDVQQWIESATRGDQRAIEALSAHFEPALLRYVESQMGRAARRWAEPRDIVQIVLGAVMCDLNRFEGDRGEDALLRRLFGVAHWRICDLARRHRGEVGDSHRGEAPHDPPMHESTMGPVTVHDRAHWVHTLIGTLPEDQREVVRLRALEGLEFAEVGARLGIEPDAARMRFRRAVESLRDKVKQRELEAG